MNTEIKKELKKDIENEILESHKEFKGFDRLSSENYLYFQDLQNTYVDVNKYGDNSTKWVFDEFKWFPEGLYGEVINFQNGGDDYDYEIIGERRKFLLIGNKLDEMKIDIQGQGWKNLQKTDLYKIFKEMLEK